MRKQFVSTVEQLLALNPRVVLLLGDIGVHGFRNAKAAYPDRVYNLGILEQSSVSLAAGLAREGFVPIFHSIAPFVVERAFEQIKIDFGYQGLGGVFATVGASYDYASLGCTHHCPGDVALMKTVPDMQVFVPGAPAELDAVLRHTIANGCPNYVRLSESAHGQAVAHKVLQGTVVRRGSQGTILAVGPTLQAVIVGCADLDVTVLYYTTLEPFDGECLAANCPAGKVMLVEPFYIGTLGHDAQRGLQGRAVQIRSHGVPRRFLHEYGKPGELDAACGLDAVGIAAAAKSFFYE